MRTSLEEFDHLLVWEQRVRTLGHGDSVELELSSAGALTIAREASVQTVRTQDRLDSQGLEPGMRVGVVPSSGGGDSQVVGEMLAVGCDVIVIVRDDDVVGRIANHFPRVGYRIARL